MGCTDIGRGRLLPLVGLVLFDSLKRTSHGNLCISALPNPFFFNTSKMSMAPTLSCSYIVDVDISEISEISEICTTIRKTGGGEGGRGSTPTLLPAWLCKSRKSRKSWIYRRLRFLPPYTPPTPSPPQAPFLQG